MPAAGLPFSDTARWDHAPTARLAEKPG